MYGRRYAIRPDKWRYCEGAIDTEIKSRRGKKRTIGFFINLFDCEHDGLIFPHTNLDALPSSGENAIDTILPKPRIKYLAASQQNKCHLLTHGVFSDEQS